MGDWYVIATIPTFIEKGAQNGVDSYRLEQDGTIATTLSTFLCRWLLQDGVDSADPVVHKPDLYSPGVVGCAGEDVLVYSFSETSGPLVFFSG
jgi:hypothetical protein